MRRLVTHCPGRDSNPRRLTLRRGNVGGDARLYGAVQVEEVLVLSGAGTDELLQVAGKVAGVVTLHGAAHRPLSYHDAGEPLPTITCYLVPAK